MAIFVFSNTNSVLILRQQNPTAYSSQPPLIISLAHVLGGLCYSDHNLPAQARTKLWKQQKWLHEAEMQCHRSFLAICLETVGQIIQGKNRPLSFFFIAAYSLSFNCTAIWLKSLPGVNTMTLIYTGEAPGYTSEVSGSKE